MSPMTRLEPRPSSWRGETIRAMSDNAISTGKEQDILSVNKIKNANWGEKKM